MKVKNMNINQIIDRFYKIIELANNLKFVTIDLKVVAVRELQAYLNSIDYSTDVYNNLDDSLALLRNRGYIFDYKKIDKGFIIYPQDKIYVNENDLKIILQ